MKSDHTPCIFCQIVAGNIPAYRVYEDEHTIAFLDVFPMTAGHVMVIHKRHCPTILGYTKSELAQIMETVQQTAGAIEKAYNTTMLSIGLNHGEPAGVPHCHVHIVPRYADDGGGVLQSLLPKAKGQISLGEEKEKIARHFNKK
jgi:histidine triad (HIT) family protein